MKASRVYSLINTNWTRLLSVVLMLVLVPVIQAQGPTQGTIVKVNGFNSTQPSQEPFYDGSNRTTYVCQANPNAPVHTWSVAATTLTNIVVTGGTTATANFPAAHGIWAIGMKIVVSGSATTTLNGTYYVQSIPNSTSITYTVATTTSTTYTDMTIKSAPVEIDAIWAISFSQYDASGNLKSFTWANGDAAKYTSICANRAVTTGATAIFYW